MARLIKESVPSQIKCRSQIIGGTLVRAANAIVQLADEEAADLIVLASHGQSGWGRIFFGSVAENVVCLSICPVLALKRLNLI
jgi:nucleotide-binding universal stress UspA family protein